MDGQMKTYKQWLAETETVSGSFGFGRNDEIQKSSSKGKSMLDKVRDDVPMKKKPDESFLGKNPVKEEVVSFDFDGVLHTSIWPGTTHPTEFWSADLEPRKELHEKVREEKNAGHQLVVVTARDDNMEDIVWEFIERHLPGIFKEVYTTNGGPKANLLMRIGAIRHYDDKDMTQELADTCVEFIHTPLW